MRNLRIAVFHNITVNGGAKRSFYELVKLLSRKHTIDFYNISDKKGEPFDINDVAHESFSFNYRWLYLKIRPFSYFNIALAFLNLHRLNKTYLRMARAIDRRKYDVVFITQCFISYFVPSLIKYLNAPKVYFCHEPMRLFYEAYMSFTGEVSFRKRISNLLFSPIYKLYNYILKINDRNNIRYADLILCNSYYTKDYINRVYGLCAKVNYLGVDIQKFRPLDIPKDNLVISVGHLEPRKAHDFIIKAVAKIPDAHRPRLAIVYPVSSDDNKRYRRYLEELAKELGVETSFFEKITDEELVALYNKAKITLCAYIREPFGLVPLESMACQTPVVGIAEAGFNETIIDNKTGILTKRDEGAFREAIAYLLGNQEKSRQMGKQGRQYVLENWSWEKSFQELENNFLSIAQNG